MRLLKGLNTLNHVDDKLYEVMGNQLVKLDAKEFSIPLLTSFAKRDSAPPALVEWFGAGVSAKDLSRSKPADLGLLLSCMVKLGVPRTRRVA